MACREAVKDMREAEKANRTASVRAICTTHHRPSFETLEEKGRGSQQAAQRRDIALGTNKPTSICKR